MNSKGIHVKNHWKFMSFHIPWHSDVIFWPWYVRRYHIRSRDVSSNIQWVTFFSSLFSAAFSINVFQQFQCPMICVWKWPIRIAILSLFAECCFNKNSTIQIVQNHWVHFLIIKFVFSCMFWRKKQHFEVFLS